MALQSASPRVELLARPAVDCDQGDALPFRAARQFGGVARRVIPAETHLHRHRDRRGRAGGGDQTGRMVEITHQRCACETARHPLAGATHVEVDPVGAGRLAATDGGNHAIDIPCRDLDSARRRFERVAGAVQARARFAISARDAVRSDHFADRRGCAVTLGDTPHGAIGYAGHRRKKCAPDKLQGADTQTVFGACFA